MHMTLHLSQHRRFERYQDPSLHFQAHTFRTLKLCHPIIEAGN